MSRALTLAPPLTPLPNLDLTRSPSLDRPGSARQSKIDRPLGLRKEAGIAPANIMGGHAYPSGNAQQAGVATGGGCVY